MRITLGAILDSDFRLVRTTAPAAYDGFGTIHLRDSYLNDRPARLVLIDAKSWDWQTGRYSSGMHGFEVEELGGTGMFTERDIVEIIWGRVMQKGLA